MKPLELDGLSIKPIRSVSPGSIFELSLGVVERGEGTRLQLEYNTDLFKAGTVKCMLADLQSILQEAVLDSERSISGLLEWTTPLRAREEPEGEALNEKENPSDKSATPKSTTGGRVEDVLVKIWQDVLQLDSIGLQDDFFDIGGHSLLAAQIFDEIAKKTGISLPLASLFNATTIEQLAELIREERSEGTSTSLVPIQPHGIKPPLFLMHAAGGNVLFYKDLVKHLGNQQPVYGLQARHIDGTLAAHETIEEMAEFYISEMKLKQPHGPYLLGGSSFGGIVALEIAQQLLIAREKVALLGLFDTGAPGYPKFLASTSLFRKKFYSFAHRVQLHFNSLTTLKGRDRKKYFIEKMQKAKRQIRIKRRSVIAGLARSYYFRFRGDKTLPKQYVQVENTITKASKRYRVKKYPGKITLFRAEHQPLGIVPDPNLGWDGISSELEIHEVPGFHGSVVREPYATTLAEKLGQCISNSETESHSNMAIE